MENHLKIKSKTTYNIHIVSREKQLCFQESIGTNAIAHKFGPSRKEGVKNDQGATKR